MHIQQVFGSHEGRGHEILIVLLGLQILNPCPTRARLPARNCLVNEVEFLGLITQNG